MSGRQTVADPVASLTALGGTVSRVLGGEGTGHYAVVMRDPEGDEFCVAMRCWRGDS